jgi:hypothetical protein
MRKFLTSVSVFIVCGMMFCPSMEGQGRGRNNGNNGGNSHGVTTQQSSPQRSNGNSGQRPGNMGNSSNNNSNNNRPNVGNSNVGVNNNRSGNVGMNQGNNNRPGNLNPGNGGWNTHSPSPSGGFGTGRLGNIGGNRPVGGGHNFAQGAPMRPYMPVNHRWSRPTPPPTFRPYRGCPRFSTILGVAIGSALNYTLNCLTGAGYNVLGYVNDAIYLSNVSMLNMLWPNATMFYTDSMLRGSEFTYSSPGYDRSRYNLAFDNLVRQYGSPVSVQNTANNGVSATWWGYDNSYVTLSFFPDYAYNGSVRYYTTLSFGN